MTGRDLSNWARVGYPLGAQHKAGSDTAGTLAQGVPSTTESPYATIWIFNVYATDVYQAYFDETDVHGKAQNGMLRECILHTSQYQEKWKNSQCVFPMTKWKGFCLK